MSGIVIFSTAGVSSITGSTFETFALTFRPVTKNYCRKIGVSERSVTRAVQELFKAGLILIECKHTNRCEIVANSGTLARDIEKIFEPDILSDNSGKNISQQKDNLSETHEHEPKKEHEKEPQSVEDFKYKNPPHCCEGLVTI